MVKTAHHALHASTTCEERAVLTVLPPVDGRGDRRKQPEQGTDQINPDCILHALNGTVPFGVFVDEELIDEVG